MAQKLIYFVLVTFVVICGAALFLSITQIFDEIELIEENSTMNLGPGKLVDPQMAPIAVRDQVLRGFKYITLTHQYLPDYARDTISCNNCHFDGGNSFGGKNNGISLVGVSKVYPRYSKRQNRKISLAERINNCFQRSLNGKPLPVDGQVMQDFLAYFEWISTPVATFDHFPWLGLPELESSHQPVRTIGKKLYDKHCASCHGVNGEGTEAEEGNSVPPLWGRDSFNDGAGMNRITMFAPFIHLNMPYGQPYLTEEEALDIASYVTTQPRPKFKEK